MKPSNSSGAWVGWGVIHCQPSTPTLQMCTQVMEDPGFDGVVVSFSPVDPIPFLHKHHLVAVQTHSFVKDTLATFRDNEHLKHQLQIDLPRCRFCVDGEPVYSVERLHQLLTAQRCSRDLHRAIAACGTQAVMVHPFVVLQQAVQRSTHDGVSLCEMGNNSMLSMDLCTTSWEMVIVKRLRLLDIGNESTCGLVQIRLQLHLKTPWSWIEWWLSAAGA